MKKNNCMYCTMIIAGGIATSLSIINIWACETWDIIINIIAMIGSGVLCSATVSLIIEKNNAKQLELEHKRQQEHILYSLKNRLKNLFILELRNLSSYAILFSSERKKTNDYSLSQSDIIYKIINNLNKIITPTKAIHENTWVNDFENCKLIQERNLFAFELSLSYYKDLQSILSSLILDSNIYLINNIFDEKKINALNDLKEEITSIIIYSNVDGLETLFRLKLQFFENVSKYLDTIEIRFEEKFKCYIREFV